MTVPMPKHGGYFTGVSFAEPGAYQYTFQGIIRAHEVERFLADFGAGVWRCAWPDKMVEADLFLEPQPDPSRMVAADLYGEPPA